MGLDCAIFAYPPNRCWRFKTLDRWRCFQTIGDKFGKSLTDPERKGVPAKRLLDAIVKMAEIPKTAEAGYDHYWQLQAVKFIYAAIKKWGDAVPVQILDDYHNLYLHEELPIPLQRLNRIKHRIPQPRAFQQGTCLEIES